MISRWLLLIPAIVLLSPGLLRAQEETKAFDPFRPKASDNSTMYEDIEIFRRILDRKLAPLRQQVLVRSVQLSGSDSSLWTTIDEGPSSLEGVYLKGHGIVYTATLPSLQPAANAQTNEWQKEAKLTQPVSEWESVRRQLRSVKEETKKNPEASKPPTLSDVLLKVLAENGHHFSHLGENENLTLVLTVREQERSAPARKSTEKPAKTPLRYLAAIALDSSKMRDLELLGDLHMKQGRYVEAMEAFGKVLQLHRHYLANVGVSALDDPGRKLEASVRLKLAQCLLLTGDDKQARTLLDEVIALLKPAEDKKKPAPAAKPAPTPLPVKLIISAPKRLLDQVKEGKITFEEFRAKAHVETLRFDKRP